MEENRTQDPISGFYRKTDRFPNADCEWSDGKIETSYERQYSLVQRCQFTGRYMWYDEFDDTKSMAGDFFSLRRLDFNELYDAFRQFEDENSLAPEKRLMLLWEMVHTYNDMYGRKSDAPLPSRKEFVRFVDVVLEMQKYGRHDVPLSIKAELFREIGMFSKCISLYDGLAVYGDDDEKEIVDEVKFRAMHGDSALFVIEDMRYYQSHLRRRTRRCVGRFFG